MKRAKRWFITPYFLVLVASLVATGVQVAGGRWSWAGLLLLGVPTVWVTLVHALFPSRPRTSRRYPSFVAIGVVGWGVTWAAWPDFTAPAVATVLLAGLLAYLYWYSEFGVAKSSFLEAGQPLPSFEAFDLTGAAVRSTELRGTPALLLFYRGNWCPVCTAQIDELARNYDQLSKRGIRVVLLSPQPDTHSAAMARRVSLPFEFWEDRGNAAARRLNIVDPAGLPLGMEALGYGSETPIPTAVLVDASGTILYSDQAENYRIRPEPLDYLTAFDRATGTKP